MESRAGPADGVRAADAVPRDEDRSVVGQCLN